jgi:hypothetical protein
LAGGQSFAADSLLSSFAEAVVNSRKITENIKRGMNGKEEVRMSEGFL